MRIVTPRRDEPGEECDDLLVEQQSFAPKGLVEKNGARRSNECLRESEPLQQARREVAHSARCMDVE